MRKKYKKSKNLLQIGHDAKTVKGQKYGYMTGIMYLSPADLSGRNLCSHSTAGCRSMCLNTAGRGQFDSVQTARLNKSLWLLNNRPQFIGELRTAISRLISKAAKARMRPCVRVNGTSDLPWLATMMAREFPEVQFYDYTKIPKPWLRQLPNYSLTFSLSEVNLELALDALRHQVNVAVVFDTRKGESLPETWHGYRVIDGDVSDLRFTDPMGVVVGLRAKGRAKRDTSGFVQHAA